MSTKIWNGHRTVTILNARERVTGRRGSWSVNRELGDGTPIVGFRTKREALTTAANIARAARRQARELAAAVARLDGLPTAERAEILTEAVDRNESIIAVFARRDAARITESQRRAAGGAR